MGIFVLPSLLAVIYFGLIAADRFTTEAQFVVRSPSRASVDQLTSLIQTTGTARADDEASALHEFIKSRDAMTLLVNSADLRGMFSRPEADFLWRFPNIFSGDLQEKLFEHYLKFIDIKQDSSTGISKLTVQAFRPDDSVKMATTLIDGAEALVNRLNDRARRDTIAAAEREVASAKERAFARREELTAFRTKVGTVDPAKTSASLLETIGKLSFELAQVNAQLSEMLRSAPQGPQIANLRNRMQALELQIVEEKRRIGGTAQALAPLIADYERLILEREFADRTLASALASLENARMEAQRQQIYLERVVEPRASDYPAQPKRIMWIAISMALSFAAYTILSSLIANVREHQP
ncbi:hypothetical protein ASG72_04170 [Bosea sp. Leaf344]|nr:hypothetical protein ASG72_04170 [Bosea sp. Leaf344]